MIALNTQLKKQNKVCSYHLIVLNLDTRESKGRNQIRFWEGLFLFCF